MTPESSVSIAVTMTRVNPPRVASVKVLRAGCRFLRIRVTEDEEVPITQASVAEVVGALRPRYLRARRGDKTMIRDEFVAVTGYHRQAAIRALRGGRKPRDGPKWIPRV